MISTAIRQLVAALPAVTIALAFAIGPATAQQFKIQMGTSDLQNAESVPRTDTKPQANPSKPAIKPHQLAKQREVRDGASNTMMLGEQE